jgi:elongator complex protein 2
MGHDEWVTSVQWHPTEAQTIMDANGVESTLLVQPLKLLSSSADKSMIIWEPDSDTGVWTSQVQIGDFGGYSFGVFGALWMPVILIL